MRTLLQVTRLIAPEDGPGPSASPNSEFLDALEEAIRDLRAETSEEVFDLNTSRSRLLTRFTAVLTGLAGVDEEARNAALIHLATFCEHLYNELQ